MTSRARYVRGGVASVALTALLIWLLSSGGLPLVPSASELAAVDTSGVVLAGALMLCNMLTRFLRCHYLIAPLAPVPLRRLMTTNAIGMAAITFLPLRLGEFVRPAMLRERGGLSAWAVTGTVGAERVIDGVVFSLMLLGGLALAPPQEPLPDHVGALAVPVWLVPRSAQIASLAFIGAFALMLSFYRFRAFARRVTERCFGVLSPALGRRVADIVERLSDGLGFLTKWRYSLPYLAVTLVSVTSLALTIDVLARAAGIPELTFAQSFVVLGVLALGFSAPNTPGFFGVVQLALYAGLATYVAPEKVAQQGGAFVFVYYLLYLGSVTSLALVALATEMIPARRGAVTPAR
ncbi:MAG TPA: lysylphosphatidylglycerol synthase transmembrane domain-containing protein [Polyangiaceae bacterium]|nr:lysylphosphatidylglycerol synthase transmembrane domain-containing protein [Polyangiaceae bacterium]